MTRIYTNRLLDYAKWLYNNGMTITEVAKELEVNADNLSKALRTIGFTISRKYRVPYNAKQFPVESAIRDYVSGMSELAVSKKYGIERNTIRAHLLRNGIKPRNGSEANIIRMSRLSIDDRKKLTDKAHIAVRGTKNSIEHGRKIAKSREIGKNNLGFCEEFLAQIFADNGIKCIHQAAIETYNIDILVGSIAVELRCETNNPLNRTQQRKKIEYLLDAGYHVFYILFKRKRAIELCTENIISDIRIIQNLPPVTAQYRVVWCGIERCSRIRNDRGQFACISSPEKALYVRRN